MGASDQGCQHQNRLKGFEKIDCFAASHNTRLIKWQRECGTIWSIGVGLWLKTQALLLLIKSTRLALAVTNVGAGVKPRVKLQSRLARPHLHGATRARRKNLCTAHQGHIPWPSVNTLGGVDQIAIIKASQIKRAQVFRQRFPLLQVISGV